MVEKTGHEGAGVERDILVNRAFGQAFGHDTGGGDGAGRDKDRQIVAFFEHAPDQFQEREAFADAGRVEPDEVALGPVLASLAPTLGDAVGVLLARLEPLLQLAIGVGQPATSGPGQVEAERQRVSHRFLCPARHTEGRNPCCSRGAAYGTAARGQAAPGARGKGNRTDFVNAMPLGGEASKPRRKPREFR
jgi:hypothetical protein